MFEFLSYSLSYESIAGLFLAAFLIGMAKTGISGAGMFAVPFLALLFGGKVSSGIMLPMLIMADVFAVTYYHRHANWRYLIKLFPSSAVGVVVGTWMGSHINDEVFKLVMGVIIFISLAAMIWMEFKGKETIPDSMYFAGIMGLLGGITTMIGNLAGTVMALYLLSMRLPKNVYIGTAAWFFFVLNVFKVPFHVFAWQTITVDSVWLSILGLPCIALGAYVGILIVKRISDQQYRWFVVAMTAVAAVSLMV